MTNAFLSAYRKYDGSNRDTRSALWELCDVAYTESQGATIRSLSAIIGLMDEDTVGGWVKVGWLISYCGYAPHYKDVDGRAWNMLSMWESGDTLSYDHLLRTAKLAKRLELDPEEILERLYNAMTGGQFAEALERDIEEAHEQPLYILRRDFKRFDKRGTQNIESFIYRLKLPDSVRDMWNNIKLAIEAGIEQEAK